MSTDTAGWLWGQLRDLLRDVPLTSSDSALFLARLAAWHRLPADLVPEKGRVPADPSTIDVRYLRDAWSAIEGAESLGSWRFAFARASESPYQFLSDETVRQANQVAMGVLLLDARSRLAFADEMFQALTDPSYFGLPIEVAELSLRLLQAQDGEEIVCVGTAVDSVAIAAIRMCVNALVVCARPPVAATLYAALTGSDQEVVLLDPFDATGRQFLATRKPARAVVVPDWGRKNEAPVKGALAPTRFGTQSSEALAIETATTYVRERAVVALPNGPLFNRTERVLREHLIRERRVLAVIGFPTGLIRNTSLPFNLVVLRSPSDDHSVRFFQVGDKDHLTGRGKLRVHQRRFLGTEMVIEAILDPLKSSDKVPAGLAMTRDELIATQDFILVPSRYLLQTQFAGTSTSARFTPLGDLVEVVKPQFLPAIEDEGGTEVREVIPGDLPEFGYLMNAPRSRAVRPDDLKSRSKQELRKDDVLLSTKGTIGRVGIVGELKDGTPVVASQSLLILRTRKGATTVDPRYLLMYLRSPMAQRIIGSLAVGVTIPNISLADIRALPVPMLTRKEQEKLLAIFEKQLEIQNQVAKLQSDLHSLASSAWAAAGLTHQQGFA